MGRPVALLVIALTISYAAARRVVSPPPAAEPVDPLDLLSAAEPIDPLAMLSDPAVDPELQPEPERSLSNPRGQRSGDRQIEAILDVEDLTERDHTRVEEQRHALNCHKFGNHPVFRTLMAKNEHPQASLDPHVIAVEEEVFDEPEDTRLQMAGTGIFTNQTLALPAYGSGMGSKELHKCVQLSYTNNAIQSKKFLNAKTNREEKLELPTFPQTLGVFEIGALFHDRDALGKDEFYIVIIEAIKHEAGLATCSLAGDPEGNDKDAKGAPIRKAYRKTWVVHGLELEEVIEQKAMDIAKQIKEHDNPNVKLHELAEDMKKAEKHIPFNHKLETAKVTFKKCTGGSSKVDCKRKTEKYLHDMAFTTSSEQHPTLDFVKLSSSDSQDDALDTSPGFLFPDWSSPDGAKRAELKGAIDWHTTISAENRCIPAMKQWLYVGLGTDSLVDLDLAIVLYQKSGGQHKRHLLNFRHGVCWNPSSEACRKLKDGRHWLESAEYSGDSRTGAGEGDDEWMFLDLSLLKKHEVDVITIMVHSYAGKLGSFAKLAGTFARIVMGDASGNTAEDQALMWSGAETVDYVDIDELRSEGPPAVLIGILSLEAKDKLVLPKETINKITPSRETIDGAIIEYPNADGEHFNLAIKKYMSVCGEGDCDVGDSVCDVEQNVLGLMGECDGSRATVGQPKMKVTEQKDRQDSLTTVESSELDQPKGAVLDPLSMLTPPIEVNNGGDILRGTSGYQDSDGHLLSSQDMLEKTVDKRTADMSEEEWLREMLVEFPGGPPGADTLCVK